MELYVRLTAILCFGLMAPLAYRTICDYVMEYNYSLMMIERLRQLRDDQ
jgi:hypothetical protein